MSLENEVYQQSFRNVRHKAIVNVIYTFNWLRDRMQEHMSNYDITMQQFNILRILRGAGQPLSTLQIRERMLDKMSDTSRIVDRLVLKNMVEKKPCGRDKRLVDVMITDKGLQVLQEMDNQSAHMDSILKNLSNEEVETLNTLLDNIREKMNVDVE